MTGDFSLAVHGLVYLNHKKCMLSSEALAENICTNPARVRRVMACLKKAGLVTTKEGYIGGYAFVLNPKKVNLKHISEALDVHFVSSSWKSGDMDMECLVASGMSDIMEGIYSKLNAICFSHLENITIEDIDKQIFGDGTIRKKE